MKIRELLLTNVWYRETPYDWGTPYLMIDEVKAEAHVAKSFGPGFTWLEDVDQSKCQLPTTEVVSL